MTIHNEAKKEDIAKTVIMPGDPMRAKYIAETYLEDYRLVNQVRGMYAFTGKYNGKEITVMGSGMGMPSMGIYSYELFKFYDVEQIIRIGTCGSHDKDIKVFDIVLANRSYSVTEFEKLFNDDNMDVVEASKELNDQILKEAEKNKLDIHYGQIVTSDVFDVYVDKEKFMKHMPKDKYLALEMEAYALFYMAKFLNKKAACLLTVVDSMYDSKIVSPEDREQALDKMIQLALDSVS